MSRRIVNPTRNFSEGNTKIYVDVPSDDDPSLRQRKYQDWKLRIWKEVQEYNQSGGLVVFFTATYNNENMPHFRHIGIDGTVDLPCFDKTHYVKFMSNLRGYFYRKYGFAGPGDKAKFNRKGIEIRHTEKPIRVMWPCEYGMDSSKTMRPHYHPLLFIPKEYIKLPEFSSQFSVKKLISSLWPYGFCIYSKQSAGGIFVQKDFVATYVSKYCFKQTNYYSREDVRNFLYNPDGTRNKVSFELMKGKLPTHWQSLFFGAGLIDDFDNYESYRDGINFGFEGNTKSGVVIKSKMPQYVERKILYDRREDMSLKLNEKGREWRFKKFQEKLVENSQNQRYVLLDNLEQFIDSADIFKLFGEQNIFSHYLLRQRVKRLLGERSFLELQIYNTVWKNLHCRTVSEMDYLDSLSYYNFYIVSCEQYYNSLVPSVYEHFDADGIFKKLRKRGILESLLTFNSCMRFDGFEELNNIYEKVYTNYRQNKQKKYEEDLLLRKKLLFEVS